MVNLMRDIDEADWVLANGIECKKYRIVCLIEKIKKK